MSDRRPVQRDERTPIERAIDDVAELEHQAAIEAELAKLDPRAAVQIPLLLTRHEWDGKSEVTIGAIPGGDPTFLMWDDTQGAFRAVVLPEGSSWRVVPDRPALWRPGGST